ncbi:MAG: hypothetical protein HY951_19440 [Bacteroidia bacterium]|nr:hypothetical protein [Bacteroidia bacterium]
MRKARKLFVAWWSRIRRQPGTREVLSLLQNKPKEQIKLISHIAKTILKEMGGKKKK